MGNAKNRILKDLEYWKKICRNAGNFSGYELYFHDENKEEGPYIVYGVLDGFNVFRNTFYEEGTFLIKFVIPNEYPFEGLSVKMVTTTFHPNICPVNGTICSNEFNTIWSPAHTIWGVFLTIWALFLQPEVEINSPSADFNLANFLYRTNLEEFSRNARDMTEKHAFLFNQNDDNRIIYSCFLLITPGV